MKNFKNCCIASFTGFLMLWIYHGFSLNEILHGLTDLKRFIANTGLFIIWFSLFLSSLHTRERNQKIHRYIDQYHLTIPELATITGLDRKYFSYGISADKISVGGYGNQKIALQKLQDKYDAKI